MGVLNVPNLRFPEFSEDWVQYNCSDLLEFYSTNSLSWEQLGYENNELLNLHYGLIHVGLPTLVKIKQNNLPSIKPEFQPKNYTLCKNGDVAFADASEDTNEVAKPIEFYDCSDKQIVCGLHTIHGRDKLNATEVGFKGYAFSSTPFHHKIRRLAQGSKIYSISSKNFAEVTLGVPTKKEQRKIVDLLSKLDERIATQNKIIEQLQSLIKGIRYIIYTQLDCEWIQLSNLVVKGLITLKRGNVIPKYEYSDEYCYPVYSSSTQNGGLMGYFNTYMFDKSLISWSIDGGGNFFYRDKHKFNVTNVCGYLEADESKFDYRFISELLIYQHSRMVFDYQTKAHPSVIEAMYYLPILDLEKQQCYSKLFEHIYDKLDRETSLLNKYEEQKKFLLSNMFI